MLELTDWMSDYYLARPGQVLEALIPAGVRSLAGGEILFTQFNQSGDRDTEKLPAKQQRIVEVLRGQQVWLTGDQILSRLAVRRPP